MRTATRTSMGKRDFIVCLRQESNDNFTLFRVLSPFIYFYRVDSGRTAVCFQDHDGSSYEERRCRRIGIGASLHKALVGNNKWR
jgi:hypothetical protein